MTLLEATRIVLERERERHSEDMKIFYPDPTNKDDCAQCGKHKDQHQQYEGRPFFCKSREEQKEKPHEALMDEAAELYAEHAYIAGYQKRAAMSDLPFDFASELHAKSNFIKWKNDPAEEKVIQKK